MALKPQPAHFGGKYASGSGGYEQGSGVFAGVCSHANHGQSDLAIARVGPGQNECGPPDNFVQRADPRIWWS